MVDRDVSFMHGRDISLRLLEEAPFFVVATQDALVTT